VLKVDINPIQINDDFEERELHLAREVLYKLELCGDGDEFVPLIVVLEGFCIVSEDLFV
jgi:hypothetical protein